MTCSVICKLNYQRVSSDEETPEEQKNSQTNRVHAPDAPDSSVNSAPGFRRPIMNPVPPSNLKKRKREQNPEDEIAEFTRIRVIQKKRRLNERVPEDQDIDKKRKLEDSMEIDDISDPAKRHRPNESESVAENENDGGIRADAKSQEQPKTSTEIDAWVRDPKDFVFNQDPSKNPEWSHSRHFDSSKAEETPNKSGSERRRSSSHSYPRPPNYTSPPPRYVPYNYYATRASPPPYSSIYYSPRYSGPEFSYNGQYKDTLSGYARQEPRSTRPRRASRSTKPAVHSKAQPQKPSTVKSSPIATEEDARKAGIPAGYSIKNWDPTEEPIMLLGSVFDANSLGKWIYDWTVFHHGPATPLSEIAGELWLLLIQLAGKVKRAEEIMPRIRNEESKMTVEDFLESGERLWIRFAKLLKIGEDWMWKTAGKNAEGKEKPRKMGKDAGCEFVDTIFGRDRELEKTEKLMTGIRLWSLRFDANCEDILRHPSQ
jgi:hypothetical protein